MQNCGGNALRFCEFMYFSKHNRRGGASVPARNGYTKTTGGYGNPPLR